MIDFKFRRSGGKKSRLYSKTRRAALNKIDAPHLPMRIQTSKGGYWGQTSTVISNYPYKRIKKFLLSNVGRPVNKVYSEYLIQARAHSKRENLHTIFKSFINQSINHISRGFSDAGCFYVTNGILNYKGIKPRYKSLKK